MPTICELQIIAKSKGLVGYSKLRKAELMKLVGDATQEKQPYPSLPVKRRTTKATTENLNALAKKMKKKITKLF